MNDHRFGATLLPATPVDSDGAAVLDRRSGTLGVPAGRSAVAARDAAPAGALQCGQAAEVALGRGTHA